MHNYLVEHKYYDRDDMGFCDESPGLSVNVAGYYRESDLAGLDQMNIARKNGRRDYTFCYVAQGRINLTVDRKDYVVQKGFFLIPPNVPHQYNNRNNHGEYEIYWIHFTGSDAGALVRQCGLDGDYVFITDVVEEIHSLVQTMIREMIFKHELYENIIRSLLTYVLSAVARRVKWLNSAKADRKFDARVQKALEHIYLYYTHNLSIKELADLCNLSVSRFSALFKQTFGLFPLQYIILYRVKRACILLQSTEKTVTQIAEMVGFNDSLYFSRIFRKNIGVSPTHFRNSLNPELLTSALSDKLNIK